ncbi:MAG: ankyrin repeat domain-containing protein [Planctomycetota bacterium]
MNVHRYPLPIIVLVLFLVAPCEVSGQRQSKIHIAVKNRRLSDIRKLLTEDGTLINKTDGDRRTPLHLAARYGSAELVSYLLQQGSDVNARCYNDFTPLHLTRNPEIARVLIKAGADLEAKSASGTAMKSAVSDRNLPLIKVFLDAGQSLSFENLVELEMVKEVAKTLEEKPWLAKSPRKVLHTASRKGNLELVRLLLRYGADPNQDYGFMNVSGVFTPLCSAVRAGHYEIAKLLCERGARTDVAGGKFYDTLLLLATAESDAEFVKLLVEYGVDVQVGDDEGRTPLHIACSLGDSEKVLTLIDAGADVNVANQNEATPYAFAMAKGHDEIADVLIERGALLDLFGACAFGRLDEVQEILNREPESTNSRDSFYRTPLFWAVDKGHVNIARRLIEAGADVKIRAPDVFEYANVNYGPMIDLRRAQNSRGDSLFHVAADHLGLGMLDLLFESGADINAIDSDGRSPMERAFRSRSADRDDLRRTVKWFIDHGAEVHPVGAKQSALSRAVRDVMLMRMLLDAETPDQKSLDESLRRAADGNDEVSKLLLDRGAVPDIYAASSLGLNDWVKKLHGISPNQIDTRRKNYPRLRPIELAACNGRQSTIELMLKLGAKLRNDRVSLLACAASSGDLPSVEFLIDRGAKLEARWNRSTALQVAVAENQKGVVEFLVRKGAKYRVVGDTGRSLLHIAASANAKDLIGYLVQLGIPVDAEDSRGDTALHDAASRGSLDAIKQLLESGADVNAANHRGQTPLDLAAVQRSTATAMFSGKDNEEKRQAAKMLVASGGQHGKESPSRGKGRGLNSLDELFE